MGEAPQLKIELALTTDVYHKRSSRSEAPILTVTTTLLNLPVLTLDNRGDDDASTILGSNPVEMRGETFSYTDSASGEEIINDDPYPGSCVTHGDRPEEHMTELRQGVPNVAKMYLDDSPLSDPVNQLKAGHEYRIKVKPQIVKAWKYGIKPLLVKWRASADHREMGFVGWDGYGLPDESEHIMVSLECEQEVLLKVEK